MNNYLTQEELQRYKRHIMLKEIGQAGQLKIKNSKVLIIGLGGLGCPVAIYLAAAGVGKIGIMDFDTVDTSNLQRQILYTDADVSAFKATAARKRLKSMNENIEIIEILQKLEEDNSIHIFKDYDIIVDATDNFKTRYLINDTCKKLEKPCVYGAIGEFYGQITIFDKDTPCLRCLNPIDVKETEKTIAKNLGVLGAVPGVIGSLQGVEVIKLILGLNGNLKNKMLFVNLLTMEFDKFDILKNPKCSCCL